MTLTTSFSSGALCYQGLRTRSQAAGVPLDIRATVFDSCPGQDPPLSPRATSYYAYVVAMCAKRDGQSPAKAIARWVW